MGGTFGSWFASPGWATGKAAVTCWACARLRQPWLWLESTRRSLNYLDSKKWPAPAGAFSSMNHVAGILSCLLASLGRRAAGWLAAVGFALASSAGPADAPRAFWELRPVMQPPVIDGQLDDPCWRAALPLTSFTQVLPVEGAPPTERTEVRFVYDHDNLYIAVRCFDHEPGKIIVRQMQRDSVAESDDQVKIAFDTFARQRDGYFFAVNPAGARTEGLIEDFAVENPLWDTIWQARGRVDAEGWTAEIAIPFKSLSFDPQRDTWGCNIERIIRRKQETVRWTAVSRAEPMTTLADFGELRGLHDLHQGRGLEVKPFVSFGYQENATTRSHRWKLKPGGDVTYNITPSLKLNATVNTDFAEADVDQRVVNLSHFAFTFPEKRDFFLQDAALFNFAPLDGLDDGDSATTYYYSRRIGLSAVGQPVDILAGGRLTGHVGNTSIALLDVQEAGIGDLPSKNLFVGRISTKVLTESNLGILVTHGDPGFVGSNTLAGLDFNYLNSRLPNKRQLLGHASFVVSSSDRWQGTGTVFGASLNYPNEPFGAFLTFRQISDKFDPGLGFVAQRSVREYMNKTTYVWRPNTTWVRSVSLGIRPHFATDLNDRLISEDFELPAVLFTTAANDLYTFKYIVSRDDFAQPFAIWRGVSLAPGNYDIGRTVFKFNSSTARPVAVSLLYLIGPTYYTGSRLEYKGTLDWRPSRFVSAGIGWEERHVHLREGNFVVRASSATLNLALTPDLSWNSAVQFDNHSSQMGLNSRLRYTYRPGSDFFFVVNQGWDYDEHHFDRTTTAVTTKIGGTWRF